MHERCKQIFSNMQIQVACNEQIVVGYDCLSIPLNVYARQISYICVKSCTLRATEDTTRFVADSVAYMLVKNLPVREITLNSVFHSGSEICKVFASLKLNNVLSSLCLSGICLDDQCIAELAEGLGTNQCLRRLNISLCSINDSSMTVLEQRLVKGIHIIELDISQNAFTDTGVKSLFRIAIINDTLQILNMSHLKFNATTALEIKEFIRKTKKMRCLDMGNCEFGPIALTAIADGMRDNKSICTLCLFYNSIGSEGMRYLLQALMYNKKLTDLNLGFNLIESAGIRDLETFVATNHTLKTLEIPINKIDVEGAKVIASCLSKSVFTRLDISNNTIKEGIAFIMEALHGNELLEFLNINTIGLGPNEALHVADMLKNNSRLSEILLYSNGLLEEGICTIVNSLVTNHALRRIDLRFNEYYDNFQKPEGVSAEVIVR